MANCARQRILVCRRQQRRGQTFSRTAATGSGDRSGLSQCVFRIRPVPVRDNLSFRRGFLYRLCSAAQFLQCDETVSDRAPRPGALSSPNTAQCFRVSSRWPTLRQSETDSVDGGRRNRVMLSSRNASSPVTTGPTSPARSPVPTLSAKCSPICRVEPARQRGQLHRQYRAGGVTATEDFQPGRRVRCRRRDRGSSDNLIAMDFDKASVTT